MLLSSVVTGNEELDNLLASIVQYLRSLPPLSQWNSQTGEIRSGINNQILGYLYRYLHIKFADDKVGTNFGDTYLGRKYYGTFNSESATESLDYTNYTWTATANPAGFEAADKFYFRCLGGRAIDFKVDTVLPSGLWSPVPETGTPIDLDYILPLLGLPSDTVPDGSLTTAKYSDSSVTFGKFQNISGGVVLGRVAGPAGIVTELTASPAGLAMLSAADVATQRLLLDFVNTVKVTVTHCIPLACSDETTQLVPGTCFVFRMPYGFLLSKVKASLNTAQTSGATFELDILRDGVSIFNTRLTISNTTTSSELATVPAVLSTPVVSLPNDSVIEVQIIATGTGCSGLKVSLIGVQA
jgi:hypothetical protein